MAVMDKYLEFCDATSVGTATGTTTFGNQIELAKAANPNSGKGSPVYLHIKVSTAFNSVAGTGAPTVAFNLQHAGTNSPASYSNVVALIPASLKAEFAAGREYIFTLPSVTLKRFIRLSSVIATSALGAGSVDAWLDLSDAAR